MLKKVMVKQKRKNIYAIAYITRRFFKIKGDIKKIIAEDIIGIEKLYRSVAFCDIVMQEEILLSIKNRQLTDSPKKIFQKSRFSNI